MEKWNGAKQMLKSISTTPLLNQHYALGREQSLSWERSVAKMNM